MNNKTMGKDIANPIQREQFIKDNTRMRARTRVT